MLVRPPLGSSMSSCPPRFHLPGGRIFDAVEHLECVADRLSKLHGNGEDRPVQIGAASLVLAIENLIDHRNHPSFFPFLPLRSAYFGDRSEKSRSACWPECLLDDFQPARFAQRAPRAHQGPICFDLGRLPKGSAFDERTGAKAISQGKSPFLLVVAGKAGCEGRDLSSPAT